MLETWIASILPNLADFLVYCAIGVVSLVGVSRCLIPVHSNARALRRGVRKLEHMEDAPGGRPVWQDISFLGRRLKYAWQRFLINAEQLDSRGLSCGVGDYINDDTVIHMPGHAQLAEVIPSLLTSLGILGTFIGLTRGLSGLDVSDATKTMESIPQLLSGMTFAFATSVAGISCSLVFNVLFRASVIGAQRAGDQFADAFADLVMQRPLDHDVQVICQQEDRSAYLRRMAEHVGETVAVGVEDAIGRAMVPITASMDQFLMGSTREQISGVGRLVDAFVTRMNQTLGDQLLGLGQTLAAINQAQGASFEGLDHAVEAAQTVVSDAANLHNITESVIERFESYMAGISSVQKDNATYSRSLSAALEAMRQNAQAQSDCLEQIRGQQAELEENMRAYAELSGNMITALNSQSEQTGAIMGDAAEHMESSGRLLSDSYATFVGSISEGLTRTLTIFDENMHTLITALSAKLDEISAVSGKMPEQMRAQGAQMQSQVEAYVSALGRLERAMTEISGVIAAGGR